MKLRESLHEHSQDNFHSIENVLEDEMPAATTLFKVFNIRIFFFGDALLAFMPWNMIPFKNFNKFSVELSLIPMKTVFSY